MTVWRFLFFSVGIHILIWVFLLKNADLHPHQEQAITVDVVDQKPRSKQNDQKRQVVRSAQIPKEILDQDKKEKAKYLGENNQHVKQETKSNISGLTKNTGAKQISKNKQPMQEIKTAREMEQDKGGLAQKKKSLTDLGQTLFSQNSANSNSLDNVKDGPINALNTERFTFYSFFSRLEERIYPIWQRNLDEAVERMSQADLHRLASKSWTTLIDVIISPRGDYLTTDIVESSGNPALDRVAVRAFEEAKFFPNPPSAMVKEDGKIHLQFSLNFQTSDNALARRSSR
jgi:TonB family protein